MKRHNDLVEEMNIHCCSFASESFERKQKLEANHLLKIGFDSNKIHLFTPKKLNRNFYELQPNASEDNKFGCIIKMLNERNFIITDRCLTSN